MTLGNFINHLNSFTNKKQNVFFFCITADFIRLWIEVENVMS